MPLFDLVFWVLEIDLRTGRDLSMWPQYIIRQVAIANWTLQMGDLDM